MKENHFELFSIVLVFIAFVSSCEKLNNKGSDEITSPDPSDGTSTETNRRDTETIQTDPLTDNDKILVWTDAKTGLTWMISAASERTFNEAIEYCHELQLNGSDGFHLPSLSELRSLVRGCENSEPGGICQAGIDCSNTNCGNDSSCSGCPENLGPSAGCYWPIELNEQEFWSSYCYSTWSSSLTSDDQEKAWIVNFTTGRIFPGVVSAHAFVRCVK